MDEYSEINEYGNNGVHRVRDPFQILLGLIGIGVSGYFLYVNIFENSKSVSSVWFLCIIFIIFCLRVRAIWNGIEINYDNYTLSVPGGGISANSVFDYINPIFLLQYFLRKRINLEDIKSINKSFNSRISKEGNISYTYLISIIGKFGGITLEYSNENKRDEIFSLIREVNRMGTPFTRS
jgi:hypothetical protein